MLNPWKNAMTSQGFSFFYVFLDLRKSFEILLPERQSVLDLVAQRSGFESRIRHISELSTDTDSYSTSRLS
jgi:hypothetical protein